MVLEETTENNMESETRMFLKNINERRIIWNVLRKRRNKWIGHIIRHNSFMVKLIEGKLKWKVCRGKPRRQFITQVAEDLRAGSYCELRRMVYERKL